MKQTFSDVEMLSMSQADLQQPFSFVGSTARGLGATFPTSLAVVCLANHKGCSKVE